MNEQEVILKTHRFLKTHTISKESVVNLYTDAHNTLLDHQALKPFQRFTIDMGDFIAHPDLVGRLGDGESLFAVEAKGESDLIKGLAQAELYKYGFHYAFFAASSRVLGKSIVDIARRKNIGVISVGKETRFVHLPEAQMPLRDVYKFVSSQMDSAVHVERGQTFHFNIPTHYLVWSIILKPRTAYPFNQLKQLYRGYPLPKEWRSALSGAQKLGLVWLRGNTVELTAVGTAVKEALPYSLTEWTAIHKVVGARGRAIPLADYLPEVAAVLRLLLLRDPVVRLILSGLEQFDNRSANFIELAKRCEQIDRARAQIFFLHPVSAVKLSDNSGHIRWRDVIPEDFRSKMFHQFKSILKHAGLLKPTRLGGARTRGYNPTKDIWQLR